MRIATAAYPLDWFESWEDFAAKQRSWVAEAVAHGAELLVFPEYGSMELSSLGGRNAAKDLEASLHVVSGLIPEADALYCDLAREFGVHILAPTAPVFDPAEHDSRPMNRARLITPKGTIGIQDKQIMTMGERDPMDVAPGGDLRLFDTGLGKMGIVTCYDSEFPLISRALVEAGAEILLVPSCTSALSGYWRVRIGAMGRALEGQCVSVMASLVGRANWCEGFEQTTGMGGVFGPPDTGFPETGVLAEGTLGQAGWTYADVTLDQIAHVRRDGVVRNATHWMERTPGGRALPTTYCDLR
ncbi:MAG: carbon-nitrogen hydrolase family protein [Pseudomonadota bacterium]